MNEAYRIAMQQIKDRCKEHQDDTGEYPATLEVDDLTWETLRAGLHADKLTSYFHIPLLEDQPFVALAQQSDPIRPLHMVTIVKRDDITV